MFFRPATLSKKTPTQLFSCEHCKIFKNTYFEKHLQTVVSDSSYILHKKLNKIIQGPDWPFVSIWNIKSLNFTYSHLLSFVLSLAVIRCHSLSFFVTRCYLLSLFVIHCHSLSLAVIRNNLFSFVVTHCTTSCHPLYRSLSFVVICCLTVLSFHKRSFPHW